MFQIIYGEIINLMNSQLIEICNENNDPSECINESFAFLDVSDDDMSDITPGTAKKSDLKKAFGKMSSGRKNSRPMLNKFIGMIA